jgi:hypothetical protein
MAVYAGFPRACAPWGLSTPSTSFLWIVTRTPRSKPGCHHVPPPGHQWCPWTRTPGDLGRSPCFHYCKSWIGTRRTFYRQPWKPTPQPSSGARVMIKLKFTNRKEKQPTWIVRSGQMRHHIWGLLWLCLLTLAQFDLSRQKLCLHPLFTWSFSAFRHPQAGASSSIWLRTLFPHGPHSLPTVPSLLPLALLAPAPAPISFPAFSLVHGLSQGGSIQLCLALVSRSVGSNNLPIPVWPGATSAERKENTQKTTCFSALRDKPATAD